MKKNILLICTTTALTTQNGYGAAFGLYDSLIENYNVEFTVVVPRDIDIYTDDEKYLSPGMKLRNIAPDKMIIESDRWVRNKRIATDKSLIKKLKAIGEKSDLVISDSAFYVSLARAAFPDKKIIYRSLDVEYDKEIYFYKYHKQIFYKDFDDQKFEEELKRIYEFEKRVCDDSDIILALTEGDANRLCELYDVSRDKFLSMPICINNVENYINYVPARNSKDVANKALIISNVPLDNTEQVVDMMRTMPEIEFHLIGKCGLYLTNYPDNVIVHGQVSDAEKKKITNQCDFAINLSVMTFGMNVKMSDYFISGIPVLASELGARGYGITEYVHYYPISFETMREDIRAFCSLDADKRNAIVLNAYNYVVNEHNYKNYIIQMDELLKYKDEFEYFVFGAGIIGKQAYKELASNGHKCVGFADNNAELHGKLHCEETIYSAGEVFAIIKGNPTKYKMVIAVGIKFLPELVRQTLDNIPAESVCIYEAYSSAKLLDMENFDINKLKSGGMK